MAHLVVLSGPSGVGKSSVINEALKELPETWLSVSVTTREPRPGEVDGVNYFFISKERYDEMAANGDLLEWASFAGNHYGTPRDAVEAKLAAGIPVLLEIEVQGARQVRTASQDAVLVFLEPPTWEDLERRLTGRGTESPEQVALRLQTAREELESAELFDHVIVNSDVAAAARELVSYLR